MEKFKPEDVNFVYEIKRQFKSFIDNSKVLDSETKCKLLGELELYWGNDNRFDGNVFIDSAISYSLEVWRHQNFKIAELWKQVAINAANTNMFPHKVANETVDSFREQFDLEKLEEEI